MQVRVAGVALDASGQHVLLLKPIDQLPGDGMVLPVWIGQLEATSILVAVEQAGVPRPLAHDLMRSIITTLGGSLDMRSRAWCVPSILTISSRTILITC